MQPIDIHIRLLRNRCVRHRWLYVQVVLKVGVEQKRENQEMKMRLFFIMLCVFSLQYAAHADLAPSECLTAEEAKQQAESNSNTPYYCPTGETKTTYTCESGWEYDEAKETCIHYGTSNGSDLRGYYKIDYTGLTCDPTTSEQKCYAARATGGSGCRQVAQHNMND